MAEWSSDDGLADGRLVWQALAGDQQAFTTLIRRYERPLSALIRYQVDQRQDAEDLLQETLIDAWTGLAKLRDPERFYPWLLQVARNRCYDYHRSPRRREISTDACVLETLIEASPSPRISPQARLLLDRLEELPLPRREVARQFYMEGFSIAEIANRSKTPPGTVKRRLFEAREEMRKALGIPDRKRSNKMTDTLQQPPAEFPPARPEITIQAVDVPPFPCRARSVWGLGLEVGERSVVGNYYAPVWNLGDAFESRVVGPAEVHGVEGVRADVRSWKPASGWNESPSSIVIGRVTPDQIRYLATLYPGENYCVQTFLDERYLAAWPEMDRWMVAEGRVLELEDGSLRWPEGEAAGGGSGVFDVAIGAETLRCMRLFDLEGPLGDTRTVLTESYLMADGRAPLTRHYCRPDCAGVVTDSRTRRAVNGVEFVHWYDSLG